MTPAQFGQVRAFLSSGLPAARIGVIGDLALDRFVFGSVERISPEAPVPVLHEDRREERLGCAANVVANLAALGAPFRLAVDVHGSIGADESGHALEAALKKLGSGVHAHLVRDERRPTTVKTRFLAGSQHQLLRVDSECTEALPETVAKALEAKLMSQLDSVKVLIVQDYAKGLLSAPFLARIFAEARKRKIAVLVDPNRNTPANHYRGATVLTPNVQEAEALLGRHLYKAREPEVAVQACRDLKKALDLESVVLTRSAHGMTLLDHDDQVYHLPAVARAVFDVTGAGDTVVALLGAAMASGAPLSVACTLATAAASVVVAKVGTATASVAEIEAELDRVHSV